jgi:hypothetical protein
MYNTKTMFPEPSEFVQLPDHLLKEDDGDGEIQMFHARGREGGHGSMLYRVIYILQKEHNKYKQILLR